MTFEWRLPKILERIRKWSGIRRVFAHVCEEDGEGGVFLINVVTSGCLRLLLGETLCSGKFWWGFWFGVCLNLEF